MLACAGATSAAIKPKVKKRLISQYLQRKSSLQPNELQIMERPRAPCGGAAIADFSNNRSRIME